MEGIFFDGIAQLCRENLNSTILLGDINATPFSFRYQRALDITKLQDSNSGFGYQPTWPAQLPLIPIDHCFMSRNLVATTRKVGSNISSDHLPLYVEITIAKSE